MNLPLVISFSCDSFHVGLCWNRPQYKSVTKRKDAKQKYANRNFTDERIKRI